MFGGRSALAAALRDREVLGGPILARPFLSELRCEGPDAGVIVNNPTLTATPAFAAEYSQVLAGSKLLAVADEVGYVSVVDTAGPLPREMAEEEEASRPRAQWLAHNNAVFDLAWTQGDQRMLTASGDQTVALWDTASAALLGSFRGHRGSVKAVEPQPGCHDVFATGARDGVLMVWDARTPAAPAGAPAPGSVGGADGDGSSGGSGDPCHGPVITVQDAHALEEGRRRGRARRTPLQGRNRPSVTSLAFLQDGNTLVTGGVDGILKLWDLRLTAAPTATIAAGAASPAAGTAGSGDPALSLLADAPVPSFGQKQHGVTCLALHPNGCHLLVSLTGGHHLLYDALRPDIGPINWYAGHTVASFYVKAAFSPDGTHILSGSTDTSAYLWQVDAAPGSKPYALPGHEGEVTAVAWCPSDFTQVATTADDATVRVWSLQRQQEAERRSPPRQRSWQWQDVLGADAEAVAAAAAAAARGSSIEDCVPSVSCRPTAAAAAAAAATPAPAALGRCEPNTPFVGGSSSNRRTAPMSAPGTRAEPLQACPQAAAAAAMDAAAGAAAAVQPHQQQQQRSDTTSCSGGTPGLPLLQLLQPMTGGATARPKLPPPAAPPSTAGQRRQQQQQQGWLRGAPPSTAAKGVRRMSISDLFPVAPPPTRTRKTKQQSIAAFLLSPAAAGTAATAAAAAAEAAGALPAEPASAAGAGPAGAFGSLSPRSSSGGGLLLSPRAAAATSLSPSSKRALPGAVMNVSKRLRTSFEPLRSDAAASQPEQQPGSAAGAGGSSIQASAPRPAAAQAAAASSQLEPSPEAALPAAAVPPAAAAVAATAAAAAAAAAWDHKMAAAAGDGSLRPLQRQGSGNENSILNLQQGQAGSRLGSGSP